MASTKAQVRASAKWKLKNYERLSFESSVGFKDILKKNADVLGVSPTRLIKDAVNEYCVKKNLPSVF